MKSSFSDKTLEDKPHNSVNPAQQGVEGISVHAVPRLPVKKIQLGGVDTHVTVSTCIDPIAEIHFIKGFKSSPDLYKRMIRDLNENKINAVMVTLPDPEDGLDYLDDYEKIAKALFIDGELDRTDYPPTPKMILTHSTGGYLLTKLLMDDKNADAIKDRYQSALFAAPYYGTKYHRMRFIGPIGRLYSHAFANSAVGTTWLERKGTILMERFNKASGYEDNAAISNLLENVNENENDKAIANHRQGLYMNGPTAQLVREISEKGFPESARAFPTVFLTGARDKVCLNSLTVSVADQIGGSHFEIKGGHSFLRKTQEGPSFVLDFVRTSLHQLKMETLKSHAEKSKNLLPYYPETESENAQDLTIA